MSYPDADTPRRPVVEILDPISVDILRRKTPAERLAQAFRLWETARTLTIGSIRQQHPDWAEPHVLREAANRLSHGATERALAELKRVEAQGFVD